MKKRDYIHRYLFIIKVLRNKKKATFDEINNAISAGFEISDESKDISLRTFQRDKNEIRSIFGIQIRCDNMHRYYIEDDEQTEEFNNRMLEAFDVFNSFSTPTYSRFVMPEKRCPLGTEHIYVLLHAMQNEQLVSFTHQKYHENEPTKRQVEPYSLKEFKGRWYLVCKDTKDKQIKTFGLDRISELEMSNQKFIYPSNFNVRTFFRDAYGVINEQNEQPEEIILSIKPFQGKYLKSYPLHESQQVIVDNDNELKISLKLHITHDFIMELLSLGESVQVIQPQQLIHIMKDIAKKTLERYT